jgi:hypothetical protein
MNTYELEIIMKDSDLTDNYHHHIECEGEELKENLYDISIYGVLVCVKEDEYCYLPGNRITRINVKFLEKIQRNVETDFEDPSQLKLF